MSADFLLHAIQTPILYPSESRSETIKKILRSEDLITLRSLVVYINFFRVNFCQNIDIKI
jgi:hypothetical protein